MDKLIDRLEALLASGEDTALLRFSLASAYLKNDPAQAVDHLKHALEHDPGYSAAWKILGKALTANGETAAAVNAYQRGIEIAEGKGDKQASREMQVFLKRLTR